MDLFLPSLLLLLIMTQASGFTFKKNALCTSKCASKCDSNKCPPSESFPHMTAFDNSLIAGAFQSDFVESNDKRVYSVPLQGNSYFGWKSTTGSSSGYHRYMNFMDKCAKGGSYLTVMPHNKVALQPLNKRNLAAADWKTIDPPSHLNHREVKFLISNSAKKCLTVSFKGRGHKVRTLVVADCEFKGTNLGQLFAFRFHYHNAFCCCGRRNK